MFHVTYACISSCFCVLMVFCSLSLIVLSFSITVSSFDKTLEFDHLIVI